MGLCPVRCPIQRGTVTRYIAIRSDARHSKRGEGAPLAAFLDRLQAEPGFALGDWHGFVVIALASAEGNYATDGRCPAVFNLVEVICHLGGPFGVYETIACRIADFLGWEAHEDLENEQIWPGA
jgi:hypothetical protein